MSKQSEIPFSSPAVSGGMAAIARKSPGGFLDPVMPTMLSQDVEGLCEELRRIHSRTGIRRFILAAPGHSVRVTGVVSRETYTQIGRRLLAVKERLAPDGIEIGYNAMPTLKCGPGGFVNITGLNGVVSRISACPLDPAFEEFFLGNMREVAAIAKPFLFMVEDDFTLSNHPGIGFFGCCCDLHLRAFAERAGRHYSREELREVFAHTDDEARRLRRIFNDLTIDTLTGLAAKLSKTVAEVSPETRFAFSEVENWGSEGSLGPSIARALAGSHRPLMRFHGTSYGIDVPTDLPTILFSCLYGREHVNDDFEFFHESDPCPRVTFYASATRMEALMSTALFYGYDNCLFWGSSTYARGSEEDSAFLDMFAVRHRRFEAIRDLAKTSRLVGPQVVWDSYVQLRIPAEPTRGLDPAWNRVFGRMGIPYHTGEDAVKAIKGDLCLMERTDAELERLLSGAVLLDGEAAVYLTKRGFSDLTGVEAAKADRVAFTQDLPGDLPELADLRGFLSPSAFHQSYGNDGTPVAVLRLLEGAEALSEFRNPDGSYASASVSRFANRLGGRVVVLAPELECCFSSNVFCRTKREILRRALEWLGGDLPAAVLDRSNVQLTAREATDGKTFYLLATSLSCDPWPSIRFAVASAYAGGDVGILDGAEWRPARAVWEGRGLMVDEPMAVFSPVLLRIARR